MDLGRPFGVITPTVDGDVLAVLARADASFTGREIHRLLGSRSQSGVQHVLRRLVEQGIVEAESVGRAKSYRLNRSHLAAPGVEVIARLRDEFLHRVRSQLAGWDKQPEYAALFGSAARNQMHLDSDIDLIVIRPDPIDADDSVWRDQSEALATAITTWTGNDARLLEVASAEARRAIARSVPLYVEIERDAIVLFGRRDTLHPEHSAPTNG